MKVLYVVCAPDAPSSDTSQDRRVAAFAQWMGVAVTEIAPTRAGFDTIRSESSLAISADALVQLYAGMDSSARSATLSRIREHCREILVFADGSDTRRERLGQFAHAFSWITGAEQTLATEIAYLPPGAARQFQFSSADPPLTRQFTGLPFAMPAASVSQPIFAGSNGAAILTVNRSPALLELAAERGGTAVYAAAWPDLPDVHATASSGLEQHYDSFPSLLIFLRKAFEASESMWLGPPTPTARFIVDDPLLKDRYGFLNYADLFQSMEQHRFGTTLAFIPGNHRRTSKRWVDRNLKHGPNFSICVHGCDHTNREFAELNEPVILRKSAEALTRMQSHTLRTSFSFEPVMVFPQGRFSPMALDSLRYSGFLAAVNSSPFPSAGSFTQPIRIGDLLRPALTNGGGFPLFRRLHPTQKLGFALDLFLGKPALSVEHHEYFQSGLGKLNEFASELNAIEPRLTWPSLSDQLRRSCWTRRMESGDGYWVRFFTRSFVLENQSSGLRMYRAIKHEPDASLVSRVTCAGLDGIKELPFSFSGDDLVLDITLRAGQSVRIEIADASQTRKVAPSPSIRYRASVFLRRRLSEFRDDFLVRHPHLLQGAKSIARKLKMTGDS